MIKFFALNSKNFAFIFKIFLIFLLISYGCETTKIDAIDNINRGYINTLRMPSSSADFYYGEVVVASQPSGDPLEIVEPIYGKRVKYIVATESPDSKVFNCSNDEISNNPYCIHKLDNTSLSIPYVIANIRETIVNFTLPGKTDSHQARFIVNIYIKPVDSTMQDNSLTVKCGNNFIISDIYDVASYNYVEHINDSIMLTFTNKFLYIDDKTKSYSINVILYIYLIIYLI